MPNMKISKLTQQDTISDEALIPITSKGGKTRAITFGTLKKAIQAQIKQGAQGVQGLKGDSVVADIDPAILDSIAENTAKVGITAQQALDIIANTAKTSGEFNDTGPQIIAKINATLGQAGWQLVGSEAPANIQPVTSDTTANTTSGVPIVHSLGDALDGDGQTITYTLSPPTGKFVQNGNLLTIDTTSVGITFHTVTASDGVGADVTSQLTIVIGEAIPAQVAPTSLDTVGWSLLYTGSNGHSSLPNGLLYGDVDYLLPEFFLSDSLTHSKGRRMSPSAGGDMNALDDSDVLSFIDASTSDAVLLSGHSSGVANDPAGPPTWIAAVSTAIARIESLGKVAIMYQGWATVGEPAYTTGNTDGKDNTDLLKAANPNCVMVRTLEIIKYMKENYPARFNSSGSGYVNTPPTELFADSVHGTFAMYYMQVAALYRACTGKLTTQMAYVVPAYFGDMAAFKLELDEAVNTVQTDFYPNVTGVLLGGGAVDPEPVANTAPTANNITGNATHDIEVTANVISLSGLSDDEAIDASLLSIDTITGSHFSASSLVAGVFTYTANDTFTGDSVVTFKYTDAGALEKTFAYIITIAAPVVAGPFEAWVAMGSDLSTASPAGQTVNYLNSTSSLTQALVDITGLATGVTLTTNSLCSGTTAKAPVGDNSGFLPDVLMDGAVYVAAVAATAFELTFTGLTANTLYNVQLTGSRDGADPRDQVIYVGSQTSEFEAGNNQANGANLSDTSDASGILVVKSYASDNGGNGISYTSGLIIKEA